MIQHPTSRTRWAIGTHVGISAVCVCDAGKDSCMGNASDSPTAVRTGVFMHVILRGALTFRDTCPGNL